MLSIKLLRVILEMQLRDTHTWSGLLTQISQIEKKIHSHTLVKIYLKIDVDIYDFIQDLRTPMENDITMPVRSYFQSKSQ